MRDLQLRVELEFEAVFAIGRFYVVCYAENASSERKRGDEIGIL
mgnify:CR=1 FL=1